MSEAENFLQFVVSTGALRFGKFELKSGRISPYFMNIGALYSSRRLRQLGSYYARTIAAAKLDFDILFGPAYKGIPLASVTAVCLEEQFGKDIPMAFNRKEKKSHGEGGLIIGAKLQGKVLIIDDVITAGTAVREAIGLIQDAGAEVAGVIICFDRKERGQSKRSTIQELNHEYQIPVLKIADYDDLRQWISRAPEYTQYSEAMSVYAREYGVV